MLNVGQVVSEAQTAENRYNIVTKFMPTASGKYSIEVFHARKDKAAQTRLDHNIVGNGHRNADFTTEINTAYSQRWNCDQPCQTFPNWKECIHGNWLL